MAKKKAFRVRWINGNAHNKWDPKYERKGQNCTEEDVADVEEKYRFELAAKVEGGKTQYDSDTIEVARRDELD